MSCAACATQFSLFTREHGCHNCSFSFCSKCVQKKIPIPNLNNSKRPVCNKCYEAFLNRREKTEVEYSPPAALQRRLEALENPSRPPITVYRQNPRITQLRRGLSVEDQEIVDRLEKLKEDRKKQPLPSDDEVAVRLAKLKGVNPDVFVKKPNNTVYEPPDNRTATAQSSDLLRQIQDEVELEKNLPCPEDDIRTRLSQLQSQEGSSQINDLNLPPHSKKPMQEGTALQPQTATKMSNLDAVNADEINTLLAEVYNEVEQEAHSALAEIQKDKELQERLKEIKLKDKSDQERGEKEEEEEDDDDLDEEEKESEKVMEKILAEAALDDAASDLLKSGESQGKIKPQEQDTESVDSDELPWCAICNEDAHIRCLSCDGDLYCWNCFKECHDVLDMRDHKAVNFQEKKHGGREKCTSSTCETSTTLKDFQQKKKKKRKKE